MAERGGDHPFGEPERARRRDDLGVLLVDLGTDRRHIGCRGQTETFCTNALASLMANGAPLSDKIIPLL